MVDHSLAIDKCGDDHWHEPRHARRCNGRDNRNYVLRKKNVLLDLVRLDCELVVSLFAIALTDCPHKAGEEPPVC